MCFFLAGAASDVHWLNSIDGEACLLVDSYGDLGDGLAVQEAVCLIEVGGSRDPGRAPSL